MRNERTGDPREDKQEQERVGGNKRRENARGVFQFFKVVYNKFLKNTVGVGCPSEEGITILDGGERFAKPKCPRGETRSSSIDRNRP